MIFLKKNILYRYILLIASFVALVSLCAQNSKDSIEREIVSAYYSNNFSIVIEKGVNYLTKKENYLSGREDLVILSHVFKALIQLDENEQALKLVRELNQLPANEEFNRYLSFYSACVFLGNNQKEVALSIFENLLTLPSKHQLPDSIQGKIYHNLSICYTNKNRVKELENLKKSFELSKKLLIENKDIEGYNISSAAYLKIIGFEYKRYEEADFLFENILNEEFNKSVNRYNEYLYSTYLLYCNDIGLSVEFDKTAKKLEEFYLSNISSYNTDLSLLYNRLGFYLLKRGRYTEALNYYQKALSIAKPIVSYRNFRPESCKQIARIYKDLDNKNLSIQYAKQSIAEAKIKKAKTVYNNYASVAFLFATLDEIKLAKEYLDTAIVLAKEKDQYLKSNSFNNQAAWTYLTLKDYDKSIEFFEQLDIILKNNDNYAPYEYWDNTNDMALAYLGKKDYLRVVQLLKDIYQQISVKYINEIQQKNSSRVSRLFKRVNLNLGKAYYGIYEQTKQSDYLQKALEHLEQADQSIETLKSQLSFDTDRVATGDLYAEYIELAVKINLDLYNTTNQNIYLKKAFEFVQKGKSYSLLLGLNDKQIKVKAGIPDSLIQKENYLKGRLSFYQNELDHLKLSADPNADDLQYLMTNRDRFLKNLDSLSLIISTNYPRYYQLKYEPQLTNVEEVQEKLGHNQVLIDYFLSDNRLIQFVISKGDFKYNEVEIGELFYDDLDSVIKEITTPFIADGNSVDRIRNFARSSYHLYSKLIGTIKENIEGKDLIIIPHAELAYLSFESLLTDEVSQQKPDMRNYPWLVNSFNISYEYNAAILSSFSEQKRSFNKVYSFAPEYYGDESMKDSILVNIRQAINDYLMPLASAKKEIETISQIFDSEVYEGEDASKTNFLNNAYSGNIMHLAMHSLNDELLPLNSQLVFSAINDSNEVLKAYELYNYDLNSPMVVLSSCSTGRGRRKTGEGLISLARAFKFTGVETQVFTLWAVHDESGAKLTELFYSQLKDAMFKDEALRKAKIEFIKSSDAIKAHPYYWANYVITGNVSPVEQKNSSYLYYLLLIIPLSLIVIFIRSKRNK